jgi:hypothetical protein
MAFCQVGNSQKMSPPRPDAAWRRCVGAILLRLPLQEKAEGEALEPVKPDR